MFIRNRTRERNAGLIRSLKLLTNFFIRLLTNSGWQVFEPADRAFYRCSKLNIAIKQDYSKEI